MKTFLVTGAAGFVGSAIARRLISEGHNVVTIDNLSTGILEAIPRGCHFIEGNVSDQEVLKKLIGFEFDSIIHMAGQSSGEVSFENPVYDLQTNTQSTLMLLNYARDFNCKEFVFASSMSVYGDHTNPLVSETSSTVPKSFYAVGKLASEHYMRIYSQMYGMKCTALRFFNVFGKGQNLNNLKQGMASIYLALALKENHITVKGSKDRFRDFVYIDDVVDSVCKTLDRTMGEDFEIYNVGNGRKVFVHELVDVIKLLLSFDVTHSYEYGTPGDQNGIYADSSKIINHLGWSAKIPFEHGMQKMVDWAITT